MRWQILDQPGRRKIHQIAKPLLGGVAIYLAFTLVILGNIVGLFLLQSNATFAKLFPILVRQVPLLTSVSPKLIAIMVGATLVMCVGLVDDIKGVRFSYKLKFGGQLVAAGILILGGVKTSFMPLPVLNDIVTVVWVVVITNSFNLLDNMDGLSAGIAAIDSLIFFAVTASQGQFFSALILLAYAGSVLGFLRYNYYPSKIFMGDAGSMFIGFVLGVLTVTTSYVTSASPTFVPVVMPLIILGVPIFDTLSVVIIRLRKKRPIFVGDQNHFSHRLVKLGMRQSEAVVFIYIVSLCIGLGALMLPTAEAWECILILGQAVLVFSVISFLMHISKSRR